MDNHRYTDKITPRISLTLNASAMKMVAVGKAVFPGQTDSQTESGNIYGGG